MPRARPATRPGSGRRRTRSRVASTLQSAQRWPRPPRSAGRRDRASSEGDAMTHPDVERLEATLNAGRDPEAAVGAVLAAARQLDIAGRADLLRQLEGVLRRGDPERMGQVALL